MANPGVEQLTEKERETLRVLHKHLSLKAVANELGVTESAVKQRAASACRKLGVQRSVDAARALIAAEAAQTDGLETFGQVGSLLEMPPSRLATALEWVDRRLGGTGTRNPTTPSRRLVLIIVLALFGLIAFGIACAVVTELSLFGLRLHSGGLDKL